MGAAAAELRFDASRAVGVLEGVWQAIRHQHPDLPRAVVVLASGIEAQKIARWGHWAAARWTVEDGDRVGEVLIAGERLAKGAEAVLDTLLHEAAHGLAHARGIKDTSRQGRYHNAKYRELAHEVGLTCRKGPRHGWHVTELSPEGLDKYADHLAQLRQLCETGHRVDTRRARRAAPGGGDQGGDQGETEDKPKPSRVTVQCRCGTTPRKLRIVVSVLELGPIECGLCGSPFGVPGQAP